MYSIILFKIHAQVKVTVYYSAKNASTTTFMYNQLYPAYKRLRENNEEEHVKINFVPYGKLEVLSHVFKNNEAIYILL